MKKILSLVCVCMLLVITGCSSKGIGLCEDQKYLDQFSDDAYVVDFVLEDIYYKLPCEFKQFIDNGWIYDYGEDKENKYDLKKIILEPEQEVKLSLEKGDDIITIKIANETKEAMKLSNQSMVGYVSLGTGMENENFIVMRGGIRGNVSKSDVKSVLKDMEGYQENDDEFIISDDDKEYYQIEVSDGVVSDFTFNALKNSNYATYQSDEDKLAQAKERTLEAKKESEEVGKKYPASKYKDFVKVIEKDNQLRNYYGEFTVAGEAVVSNSFTAFSNKYVYLLKDEFGNLYAMYNDGAGSDGLALKDGDKIKVWSSLDLTDAVADNDGVNVPLLSPLVVQLEDKEVYNFYSK